jgi:hypothetical protein
MNDAPDLVFSLNSTQIKIRADGKGTVRSCFRISGTKMLAQQEFDMLEEVREELVAKFQGMNLQHQGSSSNSGLSPSTPNTQLIHTHPKDYWLTPSSFNNLVLTTLGCRIEAMERAKNPDIIPFMSREEFIKSNVDGNKQLENIPIKFEYEGYFELFLDENAYIHMIDFYFTQ